MGRVGRQEVCQKDGKRIPAFRAAQIRSVGRQEVCQKDGKRIPAFRVVQIRVGRQEVCQKDGKEGQHQSHEKDGLHAWSTRKVRGQFGNRKIALRKQLEAMALEKEYTEQRNRELELQL